MSYLHTFCLKIELWINVTVDCGQEKRKIYKEWEKMTNTVAFIHNRKKLRIVGHCDVYFKFWANLIFFFLLSRLYTDDFQNKLKTGDVVAENVNFFE